nr:MULTISPECIES: CheR family methyltransferase [unclassified Desertifilum]
MSPSFSQSLFDGFVQRISTTTGLQIRPQDAPTLRQKIINRCRLLRLSSPEAYYELLSASGTESFREWQALISLITTGESYFFRDRGQFSVLRDRLLPELIQRQRQVSPERPTLKIWSAGCSTGEEAYSLAILLTELIADWQNWNLTIVGTDINQTALEKARQGFYGDWSFRWVDKTLIHRYFERTKEEWKISHQIAKLVQFRYDNLVEYFSPNFNDFAQVDLAICRNVFVYFDFAAIERSLQKIYQRLNPGGYLISGHTELQGQNLTQFQIKVFPESVVYQRPIVGRTEPDRTQPQIDSFLPLVNPVKQPKPLILSPEATLASVSASPKQPKLTPKKTETCSLPEEEIQSLITQAELLFQQKKYPQALTLVTELLEKKLPLFELFYLTARIHANLGNLKPASDYGSRAIELNPLIVEPYFLLAHIAEEEGNIEQAKHYLKRAIYLEPHTLSAYLELGSLYTKQGDMNRARKMWQIAVELLEHQPPQAKIESGKETTVAEVLAMVRKNLKNT